MASEPIRRVAITGGTHGNESNSVQLAKHFLRHPEAVERESFTTTVLLTNPEAITRNLRYVDEDLNRCFLLSELADERRASLEAARAREVNAALGPKGSEGATDYILDLHNTTANTGVAIMCSPHDRLSHAIAMYLQVSRSVEQAGTPPAAYLPLSCSDAPWFARVSTSRRTRPCGSSCGIAAPRTTRCCPPSASMA
jgi:succinylglutamate desuccinylase